MLLSQCLLFDFEGLPVYRLGLCVVAHFVIQPRQFVEALGKTEGSLESRRSLFEVTEDNTDVHHFIAIYARGYEGSTLFGYETSEEASANLDKIKELSGQKSALTRVYNKTHADFERVKPG